jgi:DNA repair exonuclease SbcCD ATPase subunit
MKKSRAEYTEQQWKEAQEALKNAKKTFEELGGDPDGKQAKKTAAAASKAAKEDAAERKKLFELQQKELEEQQQRREDLEDALADLAIANERDNARRELMQLEKDHKDKLDAINKQANEWKKAAYKAAEERFNATNKQKGVTFADTDEGKAGWQAQNLTAEQKAIIQAWEDQQTAIHNRAIEERILAEEKANREAISTYIKQYGSYAEKKQDIYDTANEEICELERQLSSATTDEAREAIEARIDMVRKGTESQIEELDQQYGKAKQFMIDLFGDASKKSIGEIDRIIKKYEALVKFMEGDGSISREKLVTDFGFDDAEIDQALDKLNKGEITVKEFTDALKNLKIDLGERSPWTKFKNNIDEAIKKIKNASGDGKGSQIGAGISTIGESIQQITPELDTLAEGLGNCFNVDTSGLKDAIKTLKEMGGIVEGIGQIAKKDYVGGAISIISSLGSILSGLFDDDSNERVRKSIDHRIEVANERMSELTSALEKSYGIAAQELAERTREKARDKQVAAMEGLRHLPSLNALMQGGVIAKNINKEYNLGIEGIGDDISHNLEKFLDGIAPEKLAEILADIKKTDDEMWARMTNIEGLGKYFEELADTWEDISESMAKEREQITGTSFENVVNEMTEALYDLADGSEDATERVADNWEKMMNRMVINNLLRNNMEKELKDWYEAWYQAFNGDKDVSEEERKELTKRYNEILNSYAGQVETMKQQGILNPLSDAADKASESFNSVRDAWVSTLTGMEGDTESLGKEIARIMFENLVQSNVFNKDFDEWLKDWMARYEDALNVAAPGEREGRLLQLEKERTEKLNELTEKTNEYANAVGYSKEANDEFNSSLDNLGDTLLNALLDTETDAAEMGKKIAQNLIREMLSEMLAADKYKTQTEAIRQLWQNVLKSENGTFIDAEGVFGVKDAAYTYSDVLKRIADLNNQIADDDAITTLADQYNQLNEAGKKAESSFSNLGDTILNSLTEANKTAEDFRDTLNKTLMNDLVKKQVLDVELTVNGQPFKSFNKYLEDWMKRYDKALAEKNEAELNALIEEMAAEQKKLDDAAKRLRDKYIRNIDDTTFKNMTDGFISSLMDMNATAEDWSENIGRTMAQNIIEQMVTAKFIQPLLDDLQKAFNDAMKAGTLTDAEGKEVYDWKAVLNNDGLKAALADMQSKYPELKEIVTKIMELAGVKPGEPELPFGDLGGMLIESLTDAEETAEGFGKKIALKLMNEMLTELVNSRYAKRIKEIRQHWADALEGKNGYTVESVTEEIKALNSELNNLGENDAITQLSTGIENLSKASEKADETFSSMTDMWVDALTDMNTSAEDFGKQIGRTLVKHLVKELIVMPFLQPLLDQLQNAVNNALKDPSASVEGVLWSVRGLLQQIAAETERIEPITEGIMAPYLDVTDELEDTKTAFEDLGDVIVSSLTNAGQSAEDFGKEIGQKLAEQMLKQMVTTKFAAAISGIQQDMQDALDGKEGAKSIEEIRKSIVELRADAKETGKELMKFWEETDPKEEPFKEMRDSFRSALTDMEADAKDFRKKLNQMLVDDLLDRQLSIPLTVDIGDETQVFEKGFDEYMENWNERYMNIVNATNLTQDEKIKYLDRLLDELAGVEQKYADATEDLRERLKKIEKDTTFSAMRDSFLDALMDMENGAESFAESLKRTIMRKVLEATMMENTIKPLMESLQDTISLALKDKYLETPAQMMDVIMHHGYGGNASGDFVISEVGRLGKVYEPLLKAFGLYEEQAKEGFSDLRGTLVSALMGMEGDIDNFETHVEQFGKDMRKSMTEQMLGAYIGKNKEWSEKLKQLNKDWSEALEAGDTTKLEEIRGKVEALYKAIGNNETVKDLSKKLKELEQAYDETFTSMSGNFVSMLMDFNATADDWGREIGTTLAKRIIEEMMMKQYITPYLDKVQKAFSDAITAEGATTATVQAELQKYVDEAKKAFNEAAPAIRKLMNAFQLFPEAAATPIDDLRSSFRSALMDMSNDTKSFADDINKILTEAFIDKFVLGEGFDKKLKEWQKQYEQIMGSGISDKERAKQLTDLKNTIAEAKKGYAEEAKAIHELMGTNNVADQSAYMNTAQSITYDQADLIGGMMTSLVIGQADGNEVRKQILATLQGMAGITSPNSEAFAEIAEGISMTNNWLRNIYDVVDKIRQSSAISADAANVIASKL